MSWSGGTYTRGDGTRTGTTVFQQQSGAGINIEASWLDAEANDMATAINNCLTKDGQNAATGNISMGTNKLTNLGAATASTDAARLSNVQALGVNYLGVAGGTGDVLTGSVSPAISAYANGQTFTIITNAENTTAPTLNVNSLGAVTMYHASGANIRSRELSGGMVIVVIYYGGNFFWIKQNPFWKTGNTFTLGTQAGSVSGISYTDCSFATDGSNCALRFKISATQNTSSADYWTIALPLPYVSVAYDIYISGFFSEIAAATMPNVYMVLPSGGGSTARLYIEGASWLVGASTVMGHNIGYNISV